MLKVKGGSYAELQSHYWHMHLSLILRADGLKAKIKRYFNVLYEMKCIIYSREEYTTIIIH